MDVNIRGLDIRETFEMFLTEWEDEDDELGDLVIRGINIKFSLFDYIKMRRNIVEKDKIGVVIINNKKYNLQDFDIELANREKLMKRYLLEKLENKPIVKIRGIRE